jgi:hypothetical protein
MASSPATYPFLSRINDEATRSALRLAADRISRLEAQLAQLSATVLKTGSPVNAYGQRISNVGDPQSPSDAVNVSAMQRYVAQATRQAVPAPSVPPGIPGNPNTIPSDAQPLYDGSSIVAAVFAANPGLVATSCQTAGGTWDLMDAIVDALRLVDTRFAYNGKRGNVGDPSGDAITYDYGAVPGGEGTTSVYIIDVIAGHCGANPQPAWNDVTVFGPGVWISRGRF